MPVVPTEVFTYRPLPKPSYAPTTLLKQHISVSPQAIGFLLFVAEPCTHNSNLQVLRTMLEDRARKVAFLIDFQRFTVFVSNALTFMYEIL